MRSQSLRKTSVSISLVMALEFVIAGCNGLPNTSSEAAAKGVPQTYFAPAVAEPNTASTVTVGSATVNGGATRQPATYRIDDTQDCSVADGVACFSQTTTSFTGAQQGTVVNNSGTLMTLPRGLRALGTTYALPYFSTGSSGTVYAPPQNGSYAVELAGQAGGLIQLLGQPATPLVATANCPTFSTTQTFQFITLPGFLINSSQGAPSPLTWDPLKETAYGKVSVSTSGDMVSFSNIQQFTLPVKGSTGAPAIPPPAAASVGICSPTPFGNLISVPSTVTVTNPGNGQTATLAAALGIGPSNLLVEWNENGTGSDPVTNLPYNNLLGAGTGAIGLPQPLQSLGSGPVAGATPPEYLGFIYGTGNYNTNPSNPGSTSNLSSFGFSAATQPSCAAFAAQTGPLANGIYGGDFPINKTAAPGVVTGIPDPTQANSGNLNYPYGNCNLAIDLGTESGTSNGLYPAAKVWIGAYPGTGVSIKPYSFPAVAIAGQLNGKYAIFVIGLDTIISPNQAWSLYLMQSN